MDVWTYSGHPGSCLYEPKAFTVNFGLDPKDTSLPIGISFSSCIKSNQRSILSPEVA